jgi:hypothetical protein
MRKLYVMLGIVVLVLAAVAAYVLVRPDASDSLRPKATVTDANEVKKYVVVFARNPFKDDYDLSHIAGYVDNLGKADVASVKLEIQLLDNEGNRKELVKYTVEDIKAGARKTWDANAGSIAGPRRSVVKITGIEVYR